MDMPHGEEVHFLFMNNYIDYGNYGFRLSIFNTKTHFFGNEDFDSRAFDMYHDAKEQVSDYSDIDDGDMWKWYVDKM